MRRRGPSAGLLLCLLLGVACNQPQSPVTDTSPQEPAAKELAGPPLFEDITESSGMRFSYRNGEDTANHLAGAVLMGVGGVTAMGCTVGQGLSGLSTLGLSSLLAVVAIVVGSVAAFKYQMWRIERMG